MDSKIEKYYPYYNGHKPSNFQRNNQYRKNNYDVRPKYVKFKSPRTQKEKFKRKTDWKHKRNYSPYSYRNNVSNENPKNVHASPEDVEEAERKKKLSETANKLLNKIKSWSAEERDSQHSESDTTTNVEKNVTRNSSEQCNNEKIGKTSGSSEQNKIRGNEDKPKRIAHSVTKGSPTTVKSNGSKNSNNGTESYSKSKKYKVNKASLKDFQKRIQHKLINDLMQMPKENLQNVLNDPKINPLMELKMSRLVKENKLLIAQKLRSIAESKMALKDSSQGSDLFLNIDKLIDPIIETDLSVFPYELIKQMENVFQVQFDYSKEKNNSESETQSYDLNPSTNYDNSLLNELSSGMIEGHVVECFDEDNFDTVVSELMNPGEIKETMVKVENEVFNNDLKTNISQTFSVHHLNSNDDVFPVSSNDSFNEDVMVYECSTDEDEPTDVKPLFFEEINTNIKDTNCGVELNPKSFINNGSVEILPDIKEKKKQTNSQRKRKSVIQNGSTSKKSSVNQRKRTKFNKKQDETTIQTSPTKSLENSSSNIRKEQQPLNIVPENSSQYLSQSCSENLVEALPDKNCDSSLSPFREKSTSSSCQTKSILKDVSVQTISQSHDLNTLYDIPLPRKPPDNSPVSLLEEVKSIQNLINKLNERRFMIFLELAKLDPAMDFTKNNQLLNVSLVETISNGNIYLLESLKKYFLERQGNG